jgi:predicted glycoside hydrolase/deacetylase ChbG (UPF0249 family)
MRISIICLLACSAILANFSVNARTISERLGYPADQKLLIIHADDMGLISSANRADEGLLDAGSITSASLMIPCPSASEAMDYASKHPGRDMGVHLTLTSEWSAYRWGPLLDSVPSLTEHDGGFHPGLFWLFLLGRQPDVERELRAQIESALRAFHPTHIDTHMGSAFLHPSWLKTYLRLAREYRLPPMVPRWSEELRRGFGAGGEVMYWLDQANLYSVPQALARVEQQGFLPLDYLYMYADPIGDNSYDARKKVFMDLLVNLHPGVNQIIIHPANADTDFNRVLNSNPEQILRAHDARLFQDPEIRSLLAREGIRLITWREIGQAYDWESVTAP